MKNQKQKLLIDFCNYEAAHYAVMHWHYSKKMPIGKLFKLGVWENDKFIGSVIYAHIVGAMGAKSLGLTNFEACELVRVALNNHITPVSRIISITIKLLKKHNPKLKLIVSYADPEQDHLGIIYQAGNWIYIGRSTPSVMYQVDNKKIHSRTANPNNKHFGNKTKDIDISNAKKVRALPKYKYIYILDKEIYPKYIKLKKPYPKCMSSLNNKTSSHQLENDGENPILMLQSDQNEGNINESLHD